MAWQLPDVSDRHRPVPVSAGSLFNDAPELALVGLICVGLAGGAVWTAAADPDRRVWALQGLAVCVVVLVLIVRGARAGLSVGRDGIVVRRTLAPAVTRRWRDVRRFAVVEGPLGDRWRTLRVELDGGRAHWIWRMRTQDDAAGPPGALDDLAIQLEELRQRAG